MLGSEVSSSTTEVLSCIELISCIWGGHHTSQCTRPSKNLHQSDVHIFKSHIVKPFLLHRHPQKSDSKLSTPHLPYQQERDKGRHFGLGQRFTENKYKQNKECKVTATILRTKVHRKRRFFPKKRLLTTSTQFHLIEQRQDCGCSQCQCFPSPSPRHQKTTTDKTSELD